MHNWGWMRLTPDSRKSQNRHGRATFPRYIRWNGLKTVAGMEPQLLGSEPTKMSVIIMGPLGPGPMGPDEWILVMVG